MLNGTQIKLAWEALGFSTRDLVEATGLSRITLNRIEKNLLGVRGSTVETVFKFLKDKGVRFDWGSTGETDKLVLPDKRTIHEDGTIQKPGEKKDIQVPPKPRGWEDRIVRVPGGYRILPKDPDDP